MSRSFQMEVVAGYDKYYFLVPNRHLAEELNITLNQRIKLQGENALQKLTQISRCLNTPTHIRIISNLIAQDIRMEDMVDYYPDVIQLELGYHD